MIDNKENNRNNCAIIMDANEVLKEMNNYWKSKLDKYYDHIVETFSEEIAKEHGISPFDLLEKGKKMKSEIMKMEKKVKEVESKSSEKKELSQMSHKELAEICIGYGLKKRKKNLDMINDIQNYEQLKDKKVPEEKAPAKEKGESSKTKKQTKEKAKEVNEPVKGDSKKESWADIVDEEEFEKDFEEVNDDPLELQEEDLDDL